MLNGRVGVVDDEFQRFLDAEVEEALRPPTRAWWIWVVLAAVWVAASLSVVYWTLRGRPEMGSLFSRIGG